MSTNAKSFVIYRLARHNEPTLLVSESEGGAHSFVMSPFHNGPETKSVVLASDTVKKGWCVLEEVTEFCLKDKRDRVAHDYERIFCEFLDELKEESFQKLVLSHPFPAQFRQPTEIFRQLCKDYPNSLVYLISTPETGTWIGASPELLLQRESGVWSTMALAGTKDDEDTPWDSKNIAEQAYVSQYVQRQLAPLSQTIEEGPTHTLHTGNLYHLCTKFQFIPRNGIGVEELTQTLHPTPAVCGLPKDKARSFILQNEGYDRQYYAGFLGPVQENGDLYLYVNIRCAQLFTGNEAIAYAGSGLLATSKYESEWDEIRKKSKAIFTDRHV